MRCPVCFRNAIKIYSDVVAPDCDPSQVCTHCDYVVWEDWMHRLSEQEIRQDRRRARRARRARQRGGINHNV